MYTDPEVQQLEDALLRYCPSRQWEIREVTFPSTANTDLDIAHGLAPLNPENVDFIILRSSVPCLVYADHSATRTAWSNGIIRLRCTAPSANLTLLLLVSADGANRELSEVTQKFELHSSSTNYTGIGLYGSPTVSDAGIGIGLTTVAATTSKWGIWATSDGGDKFINFVDLQRGYTPLQIMYDNANTKYYVRPGPVTRSVIDINLGDPDPPFSGGWFNKAYVTTYYERARTTPLGEWQTRTFAAGNYTSVGGGTSWTVASGDVTTEAWTLVGNTMTFSAFFGSTSVTGTPTILRIAIPDSKVANRTMVTVCKVNDNGTDQFGAAYVETGGTVINILSDAAGTAWQTSVDNTLVQLTITFEIQ